MSSSSAPAPASASFAALGLDDARLLRALDRLSHRKPTPVQDRVIPLAIQGRDLLIRARTGSGKTAAYCLPLLHKILKESALAADGSDGVTGPLALVLVPTRELAAQVSRQLAEYAAYARKVVRAPCNLATGDPVEHHATLLAAFPQIVVSTPATAVPHLVAGRLALRDSLKTLVLDEADLLLSFGYQADLVTIASHLPSLHQVLVASATLPSQLEQMRSVLFRTAQVVDLAEDERKDDAAIRNLTQLIARVHTDADRFLLAYVLIKLQLLPSPTLIFVNEVNRAYRLKLFFEQFGVRSVVLNAELPVQSRWHAVEEFNRGIFQIIIATDEGAVVGERDEGESSASDADDTPAVAVAASSNPSKRKRARQDHAASRDSEYGTARGVDFRNVQTVLNFDFPATARAYTHRIGRTARNGATGVSLSFVLTHDPNIFIRPDRSAKETKQADAKFEERILERVERAQSTQGRSLQPFTFDPSQVDPFRYRMEDALRAVTKSSVREARVRELKREVLNAERLQSHFEDRPQDLAFLKHDREVHTARVQEHLKAVPEYLKPRNLKKVKVPVGAVQAASGETNEFVQQDRNMRALKQGGKAKRGKAKRHNNPLKSFKAKPQGRRGKK